jgi:hypothetical protein
LIKVKSLHFKSLSHYFAAMAINSNDIGIVTRQVDYIYFFKQTIFYRYKL